MASVRPTTALRAALLALCCSTVVATPSCGQSPPEYPERAELVALVERAASQGTPELRAEVVRLASRSDAPELRSLIAQAAGDESPLVRAAALQAQLQLGDASTVDRALLERLANGSMAERRTALDLVLRYGQPDQQSTMIERSLRHSNAEFRRYAFRRVVMDRNAQLTVARETLARALDGDDAVVAAEIVARLRRSGVDGPLHRVHERLLSDDESERLAALRVLATTGSIDAWPALRWLHEHGTDVEQTLAALSLARLGQQDTLDEVIEVIRTGEAGLTHLALRALAGLADDRAWAQLRSHRDDTRPEVRAAALQGTIALERPAAELLPFVEDDDPVVADLAALELQRADLSVLVSAVCPDLLLRDDPMPLLRLLWRLYTDRGTIGLARACAAQLEALFPADDPDVRALAARLYDQVVGPRPAEAARRHDNPQTLYALLDASLDGHTGEFRPVYRDLLDHALVAVRVIAAVGLMATTPASADSSS